MPLNVQTKELLPFNVPNETVDNIVRKAISLFRTYEHPYTEEAVRKLVETSIERKMVELIPLLRNVTGWDPENLHVHLEEELDLQKDKRIIYSFFNNMKNSYGNQDRILVKCVVDGHDYIEWKTRKDNLYTLRNFFNNYVNVSATNEFTSIVHENNYENTKFGGYSFADIVREISKAEEALYQMPEGYTAESSERWNKFTSFCDTLKYYQNELLDEYAANSVNQLFPDIRARAGQRTTSVVTKFFNYYPEAKEMTEDVRVPDRDENGEIVRDEFGNVAGFHNETKKTFNKRLVEYTEAIKGTKVKRHFIVSVNPIDFLTMSFGNSWASCHTIDKKNKRKRGDHYNGMYCGGTLSYMLDKATAVCYTVDPKYDGNSFELQDKIDRNLIHYHDGIFIQGRLYPQSNDGSSGSNLYKQFREIEERVIAEGLGAPNVWNYRNGTNVNANYCTTVEGSAHYRDYYHYSTTGTCRIKVANGVFRGGAGDPNGNYERMEIGSIGIDIYTGAPIDSTGHLTNVMERDGNYYIRTRSGYIIAERAEYDPVGCEYVRRSLAA